MEFQGDLVLGPEACLKRPFQDAEAGFRRPTAPDIQSNATVRKLPGGSIEARCVACFSVLYVAKGRQVNDSAIRALLERPCRNDPNNSTDRKTETLQLPDDTI